MGQNNPGDLKVELQQQPHNDGDGILCRGTIGAILLLTPLSGEKETAEPVETE